MALNLFIVHKQIRFFFSSLSVRNQTITSVLLGLLTIAQAYH